MKLGNKTLALPLIQGGMGIGVSLGGLAGAVAQQGGMGVISTANPGFSEADFWQNAKEANARALTREIQKAKRLAAPDGLVAINAMAATADYEAAVKTALENGVDAIISGAGLPLALPALAKGYDVLLAPIVSGGRAAALICRTWQKKHQRLPDFIVLEGSGAGGHLGFHAEELLAHTAPPLEELFLQVQQAVAPFGNIPIFVAGSVYTSAELAQWIAAGAAGVQIATRFIATEECDASAAYKQRILACTEQDICIVKSPVGMPGRALRSPLIQRLAQNQRLAPQQCICCLTPCNPATTPYCITKALIEAVQGNWENGLFFCGENAGRVDKIVPVKQLMDELLADWRKT